MSTTISRAATTGLVGGALWVLLPVSWSVAVLDDVEPGSLGWFAVSAAYWIFAVLPPALMIVGLTALRRSLGDGRLGRIGIAVAGSGSPPWRWATASRWPRSPRAAARSTSGTRCS